MLSISKITIIVLTVIIAILAIVIALVLGTTSFSGKRERKE